MRISDWSSDVCSSDLTGNEWRPLDCKPGAHANGPGPTSAERPTPRPIMGRMTGPPDRPGGSGNGPVVDDGADALRRSEEHTSELQSLMRISYAVFCLKKKTTKILRITKRTRQHR